MKNKELTLEEKLLLRDILLVIRDDSDLRRGFRMQCDARVPEMNRIIKKITNQVPSIRVALP